MNKRKSLRELKGLVEKDIAFNKDFADTMKDDKNPQIVESVTQSKARIEALDAILLYINTGEKYLFDKMDGKQEN